jgi:hypothetical protein
MISAARGDEASVWSNSVCGQTIITMSIRQRPHSMMPKATHIKRRRDICDRISMIGVVADT